MIARTVAVAALFVAVACSSINTSGEGSGNTGGVDAGTATGSTDGGSGAAIDGGTGSGSADAGSGSGTVGGSGGAVDAGGGGSGGGSGGGGSGGGGESGGGGGNSGGGGGGTSGGGGNPAAAPVRLTTGERAVALAVDSSRVYWISQTFADHPMNDTFTVRALARDGGSAMTLSSASGTASFRLRADADALYAQALRCANEQSFPCNREPAGARNVIYRFPKAGGPAFEYKSRANIFLAVDDDWLYASRPAEEFESGSLERLAKDGSSSTPIGGQGQSSVMVTSSSDLYWTQGPSNKLVHMARGGSPSTIASSKDVGATTDFALDGDTLLLRATSIDRWPDANVYAAPRTGGDLALIWQAPWTVSATVAAGGGRMVWNQDPLPVDGFHGCLGRANLGGKDGACIDQGLYHYGPVAVSGSDVFYLRNGDVYRAGASASADDDASDGEWMEHGEAAPVASGGATSGAATLAGGTEPIQALAIDADTVYWITGTYVGRDLALHAVPKAGGTPVTLAKLAAYMQFGDLAPGLIADGEWTFFNVECGVSLGCWSGTRRLSKQGGAVEWLGRLDRFTVDGDFVYFTRAAHGGDLEVARRDGTGRRTLYRGAKADAMAVWGGHLYWLQPYAPANGGKTTLYTAPADGSGSPTALGSENEGAGTYRLRVDSASVYWIWGGDIHRMPRDGGTPVKLRAARDYDVQAGRVYFSEPRYFDGPDTSCLAAVDADGSNYQCLDRSAEAHGAVRVDATSVYFVRGTKVLRVDR